MACFRFPTVRASPQSRHENKGTRTLDEPVLLDLVDANAEAILEKSEGEGLEALLDGWLAFGIQSHLWKKEREDGC